MRPSPRNLFLHYKVEDYKSDSAYWNNEPFKSLRELLNEEYEFFFDVTLYNESNGFLSYCIAALCFQKSYTIAELSQIFQKEHTVIRYYCDKFEKCGVLKVQKSGNRLLYSANCNTVDYIEVSVKDILYNAIKKIEKQKSIK